MILRQQAEFQFAEELENLKKTDKQKRPPNWQLSPSAVLTYLTGGKLSNGFEVSAKYIGNKRLMEIAIATLTTDRALLLYGLPGTAKSWVSEHLSAAISGVSTLLIQGTAGTSEESVRYGWNYARLLSEGPSEAALVSTPVMKAMKEGKLCRIEELTRMGSDVQDTLITILSEKMLPIPELGTEIQAIEGFNIIATANNRDKGINELSGALKRRFNTVILPVPESIEEEVEIVHTRVKEMNSHIELPDCFSLTYDIERVVIIFRELRSGIANGKTIIKIPSSTMSPAEAISVVNSGLALSAHFGNGELTAKDLAAGLIGAVVKDPVHDKLVWNEYLETALKGRSMWQDLYNACKELE